MSTYTPEQLKEGIDITSLDGAKTFQFVNPSGSSYFFIEQNKNIEIINPISSDLNVLRNSIFSNLVIYLNKNLDRGFKDIALFEIGPIFTGLKPGQQETVVTGLRSGKISKIPLPKAVG